MKKTVAKIISLFTSKKAHVAKLKFSVPDTATIIRREDHCITRKNISSNALKVLYRLKSLGFNAYLVGGGVRDLLLGREPKDFDIVTDAYPEQIRDIFANSRIIGRRFRLVHILFRSETIEVSTFRGEHSPVFGDESQTNEGMLISENVYGNFEDDARRRDFTINAIYYSIADFSIIDTQDGITDLNAGILRVIGTPTERYREDPVRMLRAVRLATKLGFKIHPESEQPIFTLGHLLSQVAPGRLLTEMEKLFLTGSATETYKKLRHYNLFKFLFPLTEDHLRAEGFEKSNQFINLALQNTDKRILENKTAVPSFIMAVMLWPIFEKRMAELINQGLTTIAALEEASQTLVPLQAKALAMPRHYSQHVQDIWFLQWRFTVKERSRVERTITHKRIRAALDFLELRAEIDESLKPQSQWWQDYYHADQESRHKLAQTLQKAKKRKRRPKRTQSKTQ